MGYAASLGRRNQHDPVTIYAVTSTVSGNGDQGADPNKKVVVITDVMAATAPAAESFSTLRSGFAEVLLGFIHSKKRP